jgi:hypothetical protein
MLQLNLARFFFHPPLITPDTKHPGSKKRFSEAKKRIHRKLAKESRHRNRVG